MLDGGLDDICGRLEEEIILGFVQPNNLPKVLNAYEGMELNLSDIV